MRPAELRCPLCRTCNRAGGTCASLGPRRAKAALLDDPVAKLEKLVRKGKSVTQETVATRLGLVCTHAQAGWLVGDAQPLITRL